MKKRFNISYKQDIIDGNVKVVTVCGDPVEIVKWDCKGNFPILGIVDLGSDSSSCQYDELGVAKDDTDDLCVLIENNDKNIKEAICDVIKSTHYKVIENSGCTADEMCEWVMHQTKSEWSEKDEELMKWSINNLTELKDRFGEEYGKVGDCIEWLKSIRPHWRPSENQMQVLEGIRNYLAEGSGHWGEFLTNLINDLKKL